MFTVPDGMPLDTDIRYSDAAARGQIRVWKTELAKRYRLAEKLLGGTEIAKITAGLLHKKGKGGDRALRNLKEFMAPSGAVWYHHTQIQHKLLVAIWAILHPGDACLHTDDPRTGLAQNCVTVDFISLVADLEHAKPVFRTLTGIWTMSINDHCLGRMVQRTKVPLELVIYHAHQNLLALREEQFDHALAHLKHHRFLLAAGPGALTMRMVSATLEDGTEVQHLIADTWLGEELLYPQQQKKVLRCDREPGRRLCDRRLFPMANGQPREFIFRSEKANVV